MVHRGVLTQEYKHAGPVDKTQFLASPFWNRHFLHRRLQWSWRIGTKAAEQLPDNWEELVDTALQRLAATCARCIIPSLRVYMADETFLFYLPESKCAPHRHCMTITGMFYGLPFAYDMMLYAMT